MIKERLKLNNLKVTSFQLNPAQNSQAVKGGVEIPFSLFFCETQGCPISMICASEQGPCFQP